MNSRPALKVGLGTVQFGTHYGISNRIGQTDHQEVKYILEFAKHKGITVLDTASAYGNAEEVLGENDLSSFRVISKFLPSTDNIEAQLKTSLSKMKLDALYGYLAHRPTDVFENPFLWDELLDLRERGVIQKIGFSFNTPTELTKAIQLGMNPDLIQVPYNFFDRRFEMYFKTMKEKGCEIHTRSAFLQGLFLTQPHSLSDFFAPVKQTISSLQERFKENLPLLLLKFVHDHPLIDCVIIGNENARQLQQNLMFTEEKISLPKMELNISDEILMPMHWPKKA